MPQTLHVELSNDGARFLAYGGSPAGRDGVHNIIRRWPGWRRLPRAGCRGDAPCSVYSGPISPISAEHLSETSLEVETDIDATKAQATMLQRRRRIAEALEGKRALDLGRMIWPTARRPMPHQLTGIAALAETGWRALLADDMGLGKTSTALWALGVRGVGAGVRRLLILCPQSVKLNWKDEIEATLGDEWMTFIVPSGKRARADAFTEIVYAIPNRTSAGMWPEEVDPRPIAIICNYDLLTYLSDLHRGILAGFVHHHSLICDESHYLKTATSQRTRLVTSLFSGATHRLLLSGTPVRNTVEDLYSQIQFIQPGTWTSKTEFDNCHLQIVPMTIGNKTFRQVQGARDLAGLNKIVTTLQIRRAKEDVVDLPPKIHTYPRLTLEDDSMRRIYRGMKDFAVLRLSEIDGNTNIFQPQARTGVQAALRCEQIAQGFVGGIPEPVMEKLGKVIMKNAEKIPGRPAELMFPNHPKVRWLLESIKTLIDTDHRVVVYSRFLAPLYWLQNKLKVRVQSITGSITSEQKMHTIQGFRRGQPGVLLCQVTIAEGFNLTECQDVIFMGRDWSPAINRQAEDRCHRIGTKGTVNIQIPIVERTVETMIDKKLRAKEANAAQALATVTVQELKDGL